MSTLDIILVIIAVIVVILLNIFIERYVINRALKKFIIPKLKEKNYHFERYKWVGPFSYGDFGRARFTLGPFFKNGGPAISTYIYVYYEDDNSRKRLTAKIDTLFFFIKRVSYSAEL